jgi:hypothetical protein
LRLIDALSKSTSGHYARAFAVLPVFLRQGQGVLMAVERNPHLRPTLKLHPISREVA